MIRENNQEDKGMMMLYDHQIAGGGSYGTSSASGGGGGSLFFGLIGWLISLWTQPSNVATQATAQTSTTSTVEVISTSTTKTEDQLLTDCANDVLNNNKNDTHGWTSDSLKDALFGADGAFNVVKNGELTKVEAKEQTKKKFTVYLGVYIKGSSDSYEKQACGEEGAVAFSMNNSIWGRLASVYTEDGMWILNEFFLSYCISKECNFMLVSNPDQYYDYSNHVKKPQLDENGNEVIKSYSRELEYIYFKGYRWNGNTNQPGQLATKG